MSDKKYMVQDFVPVDAGKILETVKDIKEDGYRLVQLCATKKDGYIEMMYSFDRDHVLKNMKINVPENEEIESISDIYWAAFIYENEMHDLFGVKFRHLALDYGGNFFKVSESTPWNPKQKKERK